MQLFIRHKTPPTAGETEEVLIYYVENTEQNNPDMYLCSLPILCFAPLKQQSIRMKAQIYFCVKFQ